MSPAYSLLAVFVLAIVGASHWRRRRIRRALRDLPTRLQRQLGPDPEYAPPADPPAALRDYATLHRRTALIRNALWALGFAWLGFVAILVLGGTP